MRSVVIFGASKGGKNALKFIRSRRVDDRVVFFIDNDRTKEGKRFLGLDVLSPDQLPAREWDAVYIASCYVDGMWKQLTETLGVPSEKIEILDQEVLNGFYGPLIPCLATAMIVVPMMFLWWFIN